MAPAAMVVGGVPARSGRVAGLKLLLGEMGEEMLLSGARLRPARLERSGFAFRFPTLEGALREAFRVECDVKPSRESATDA